MSEAGETIKNLYQKFVMRDLLSFITPGAVFVVSALYWYGWSLFKIIHISKEIPFVLYLPIFGVFYAIGFSFQFLGTCNCEIMKIHNRSSWKEHLCYLKEFSEMTKHNEEAKGQHERFVVLKQMCANNVIALFFSGPLILCRLFLRAQIELPILILLSVILILMILYLCKAQRRQLSQQEIWEDLYLDEYKNN